MTTGAARIMTQTAPKAYSYLRFSTPEQMKGDSRRRQSSAAKDYALKHGLELDESLTFHDLGVSAFRGKNTETGRLAEFKEAVKSGLVPEGSYLLVESLDRLSRQSARKAQRVLEEICELGITVVTLMDGKEYTIETLDSDPLSFIMSILIFFRANEESATKSKRLKESWVGKRTRLDSKPMTSIAPAWLTLVDGKWIVDEEKAKVVRRIFAEFLDGKGLYSIEKSLNAEGVPVFGEGKRKGAHWHKSYIFKLLEFPAVMGTLVPHKLTFEDGKKKRIPLDPVPGYYPAIIDAETYARVQELRGKKAVNMRGRKTTSELRNIFSMVAKCPACGSTMHYINKGSTFQYLVCSKAKTGTGCEYRTAQYSQLEAAFIEEWPKLAAQCPAEGEAEERLTAQLKATQDAEDVITEALGNILEGIQSGTLKPSHAVNQRIAELESELESVREEAKRILSTLAAASATALTRKLSELSAALKAGTLDRAKVNASLRGLFSKIEVDAKAGDMVLHWRHSEAAVSFVTDWRKVFSV